jgi:O-methyltransferase involved in polyketide biosynthesis
MAQTSAGAGAPLMIVSRATKTSGEKKMPYLLINDPKASQLVSPRGAFFRFPKAVLSPSGLDEEIRRF